MVKSGNEKDETGIRKYLKSKDAEWPQKSNNERMQNNNKHQSVVAILFLLLLTIKTEQSTSTTLR
jgi:hypothetical protein